MKSLKSIVVLVLCVSFTYAQRSTPNITYKSYYNYRFEYSISYPNGVLIPGPIATNGDGREFFSKDGETRMWVYGRENIDNQTLRQLYLEETDGTRDVVYKVLKANWFVVSGLQNGNVFYRKTLYRNKQFLTFSIVYPESQKKQFDPIIAVITKSFR